MLSIPVRRYPRWVSKHISMSQLTSSSCCDSVGAVLDEGEEDEEAQGAQVSTTVRERTQSVRLGMVQQCASTTISDSRQLYIL